MRYMHWSWQNLQETPDQVVEDILTMMEKEAKVAKAEAAKRKGKR